MKESLLQSEYSDKDSNENVLRPQTLKDFVGQQNIIENLSVFLRAAYKREETLDHVFLSGPTGLGKTTLATIIAREMNTDIRITSAPALEKTKDLVGILTTLTHGGVFFIDEIHRLRSALEETLYVAMEDFEIDWVIGQGTSARTLRIPLPRFTLVGATTRPGSVTPPMYTRFGIPLRLDYYSVAEISKILRRSAAIMGIEIRDDAITLLAESCRATPRVANRLLRRIRDFAEIEDSKIITAVIVKNALSKLNIDSYGLEQQDRRILTVIIESYNGGPVGAETLAISVGEEVESLEVFYEPFLIQQGLLQRTARGRVATARAYEILNIPQQSLL